MKRQRLTFIMLILSMVSLAGALLLLGMTLCQVYILASYQGLPPVWQQVMFFVLLLMAGGVTVIELSCPRHQV